MLKRGTVGAAALVLGLWLVPSAAADTVTIGSVAPAPTGSSCSGCNVVQLGTDSTSPSYVVPPAPSGQAWTLTSWSVRGEASDGTARLQIWRPTATAGEFQLIATTGDAAIPGAGAPVIPASIPVQAGDHLGVHSGSMINPTYESGLAADVFRAVQVINPVIGGTAGAPTSTYPSFQDSMRRLNLSGTLTSPTNPVVKKKKKKCKKRKHKRSAESAKKKKCKKRKKR
jgi:hypothetical protein